MTTQYDDRYGYICEENPPLDGIPMVKVLDEEGRELFRGWYVYWNTRYPCVFDDCMKPEDIKHCVIREDFADWNMPIELKITEVTPPHRIEVIKND